MSLIDRAAELETMSQQELISLVNNPSSIYPEFVVLSEIQRRNINRKKYEADLAKQNRPEMTVAEMKVAELQGGMPRDPLVSQEPSMTGLSSIPPTLNMAEGGFVGMQEGMSTQAILDEIKRNPELFSQFSYNPNFDLNPTFNNTAETILSVQASGLPGTTREMALNDSTISVNDLTEQDIDSIDKGINPFTGERAFFKSDNPNMPIVIANSTEEFVNLHNKRVLEDNTREDVGGLTYEAANILDVDPKKLLEDPLGTGIAGLAAYVTGKGVLGAGKKLFSKIPPGTFTKAGEFLKRQGQKLFTKPGGPKTFGGLDDLRAYNLLQDVAKGRFRVFSPGRTVATGVATDFATRSAGAGDVGDSLFGRAVNVVSGLFGGDDIFERSEDREEREENEANELLIKKQEKENEERNKNLRKQLAGLTGEDVVISDDSNLVGLDDLVQAKNQRNKMMTDDDSLLITQLGAVVAGSRNLADFSSGLAAIFENRRKEQLEREETRATRETQELQRQLIQAQIEQIQANIENQPKENLQKLGKTIFDYMETFGEDPEFANSLKLILDRLIVLEEIPLGVDELSQFEAN
jgi:hypothetical protein